MTRTLLLPDAGGPWQPIDLNNAQRHHNVVDLTTHAAQALERAVDNLLHPDREAEEKAEDERLAARLVDEGTEPHPAARAARIDRMTAWSGASTETVGRFLASEDPASATTTYDEMLAQRTADEEREKQRAHIEAVRQRGKTGWQRGA